MFRLYVLASVFVKAPAVPLVNYTMGLKSLCLLFVSPFLSNLFLGEQLAKKQLEATKLGVLYSMRHITNRTGFLHNPTVIIPPA